MPATLLEPIVSTVEPPYVDCTLVRILEYAHSAFTIRAPIKGILSIKAQKNSK